MSSEELLNKLYQRMATEQEQYRKWLLGQPPSDILDHTAEDVCCKGEFQTPNTT